MGDRHSGRGRPRRGDGDRPVRLHPDPSLHARAGRTLLGARGEPGHGEFHRLPRRCPGRRRRPRPRAVHPGATRCAPGPGGDAGAHAGHALRNRLVRPASGGRCRQRAGLRDRRQRDALPPPSPRPPPGRLGLRQGRCRDRPVRPAGRRRAGRLHLAGRVVEVCRARGRTHGTRLAARPGTGSHRFPGASRAAGRTAPHPSLVPRPARRLHLRGHRLHHRRDLPGRRDPTGRGRLAQRRSLDRGRPRRPSLLRPVDPPWPAAGPGRLSCSPR